MKEQYLHRLLRAKPETYASHDLRVDAHSEPKDEPAHDFHSGVLWHGQMGSVVQEGAVPQPGADAAAEGEHVVPGQTSPMGIRSQPNEATEFLRRRKGGTVRANSITVAVFARNRKTEEVRRYYCNN